MAIVQLYLWDYKVCRRCKNNLPFSSFYAQRANKDGLGSYCKECNRAKQYEWRKENPERFKAIRKRDYDTHRERHLRNAKKYRQDPQAIARRQTILRRFQKQYPDRYAEYERIRSHRKRAAGAAYTKAEWDALCAKYNHRCLCCGATRKLTVDHVVPISKGGSNTIDNIQPLCISCNSSKGVQVIDYRY